MDALHLIYCTFITSPLCIAVHLRTDSLVNAKSENLRSFSASHESTVWGAIISLCERIISLSGFKVIPTLRLLTLQLCYRFAFLLFGIMDRPSLGGEMKGSGEVGLFRPILLSTRRWKHLRRLVTSKCFV
jgi:hypothetical protein